MVVEYYSITLAVRVSARPSVEPMNGHILGVYVHPSIFLFPDDNLRKCQWILTKLGVCIDIVGIWFGIVNGQILSILTELSALDRLVFSFMDDNFSKYQWIFTKLSVCIYIVEICFGIADGQISSIFDRIICCDTSVFSFLDDNQ